MQSSIPTLSSSSRWPALVLLLGLAACVTAPPPAPATPAPVYPTPQRISTGQVIDLGRNEPMGLFGTRAILAEAPGCSTVRMSDGQPVRLGDVVVSPALAASEGVCPARNARANTPYIALTRAVLLSDGLYGANSTQECFLPNSGGGNCRPVSR